MLAGHEGLYDKGTHKYCCSMDEDGELKIKFKFSRPMRFSGYDIQSANDHPARDPRKWKMEIETLDDEEIEREEECGPFG